MLTRIDGELRAATPALDIPGLALVTGGAFGIVWGLVRGNQAGWGSLEVLGLAGAGALLVGGVRRLGAARPRADAADALLPLARVLGGQRGDLLHLRVAVPGVFFFAQLLQTGLGYGPLDAGLRLLPWTATFMTVAPIAGALADRFGERPFMVGGLLLQAVGMAWIALIAEPGLTYAELVLPFIVAGVGVSMAIPSAQNSAVGLGARRRSARPPAPTA